MFPSLFALALLIALTLPTVASAKRAPKPRRPPQERFCTPRGGCLSYKEIEALRRSLRDQDRSSRGRGGYASRSR